MVELIMQEQDELEATEEELGEEDELERELEATEDETWAES